LPCGATAALRSPPRYLANPQDSFSCFANSTGWPSFDRNLTGAPKKSDMRARFSNYNQFNLKRIWDTAPAPWRW
jgi:hypothetical protein